MPKNNMSSLIIELEDATHKDFKKLCIDHDISMTDVVRKGIKTWMDDKERKVVY